MSTGERLHSQVNALVALQVVVTVEALWTLIAFERTVILWRLGLRLCLVVHLVHGCSMATVETLHHAWRKTTY